MPSGSKKRKAAKKKKENHSTHSHGGDDLKHLDDVGEVSSPGSQDHHSHQNLLTEETEERENVSSPLSVEGSKIEVLEEPDVVVEEEKSVVAVEREFKIDGGVSSRSSTSSGSDDESRGNKSTLAVLDANPDVDLVTVTDSSSAEAIRGNVIEETGDAVVFDENLEEKVSLVEDKVGISAACINAASDEMKEAIIESVETIDSTPDIKEIAAQENDDRSNLLYNAPTATADNGVDREKDSGITEPLLPSALHPVEKTSWKSCCGLFEAFTGSGR